MDEFDGMDELMWVLLALEWHFSYFSWSYRVPTLQHKAISCNFRNYNHFRKPSTRWAR